VSTFSGKLSEHPLARVLSRILAGRRSGGLKLSLGSVTRQLFIEEGLVIRYAASNVLSESLTELLKQRGEFHADQMRQATAGKQANELLGSALLRLGFLAAEDHRTLVIEMIEKIVLSASKWTDAAYEFQQGELPFTQPGDAGLPVPVAILGLVRNVADPAVVSAALGDRTPRVRLHPAPPMPLEAVPLEPAEGFLLSRVDGTLTLREIGQTSPLGPGETDRALTALILAGFLQVDAVEPEADVPTTPRVTARDAAGAAPPRPPRARPAPARAPRPPTGPVEEMLSRHALLKGQNFYEVLGLASSANESEIRHSYYSLAKRLHPDKFSEDETKDRAEKVFAAITEAYATLSKSGSREEYDKSLAQAVDKQAPEKTAASAAEVARQNFLHGKSLFEKHEFVKALPFFEHAVEQEGTHEEYHRYLALVQSRNPRLRKEAEKHFLRAVELNPTLAENYAQLGILYRKMGQEEKSAQYLQSALSWDAGNETARQALASEDEKKGLLKGLFRK
jgi:curved DNA-binding protein CbpA